MNPLMIGLVAAMTLLCLIGIVPLLGAMRRQEKAALRLAAVQSRMVLGDRDRPAANTSSTLGVIASLGAFLAQRLLSERTVQEVQATLGSLGFNGKRAVGVFIGAKLMLFLLLPALGYLLADVAGASAQSQMLAAATGAVGGLLLPEMIVRNLRGAYIKQVERATADGLDMIVICSEAGLGLETAIARTAQEIRPAWPALATELAMTSSELRVLSDRQMALTGLGRRTQLEPLQRLARVMVQSQQYGTPLTQALRVLAAELRQEQLIAFEAKAARLPVLLTVPMILFILPTVFLVVAGPAVVAVLRFM